MGDLSAHFSASEFAEHGSGKQHVIDPELLQVLERIRALRGRAVSIVSGYRSPAYNRRIGGAPNSQHVVGRAADLKQGVCTVEEAISCGARGVGHCNGWAVHVDVRPARTPVVFADC